MEYWTLFKIPIPLVIPLLTHNALFAIYSWKTVSGDKLAFHNSIRN